MKKDVQFSDIDNFLITQFQNYLDIIGFAPFEKFNDNHFEAIKNKDEENKEMLRRDYKALGELIINRIQSDINSLLRRICQLYFVGMQIKMDHHWLGFFEKDRIMKNKVSPINPNFDIQLFSDEIWVSVYNGDQVSLMRKFIEKLELDRDLEIFYRMIKHYPDYIIRVIALYEKAPRDWREKKDLIQSYRVNEISFDDVKNIRDQLKKIDNMGTKMKPGFQICKIIPKKEAFDPNIVDRLISIMEEQIPIYDFYPK